MKIVMLLTLFGVSYAAPQAGPQQQDRRQNPAPFQRDPVSFQRDPASFQRDPASFPRDPASFQRDPASFQRDPASFQRDPPSFQREPASFQRDPASFQRDQSAPRPATNNYVRTEPPARILRFDNINNGDGSYNFGYETENGISVGEEGVLRARGADLDPITAVKGFFQYFAPEGQKLRVDYTADENGFVPQGDHLPTPPPIPEAIMRSLAILYANAEKQKQLERNDQNRNRF